MSEADEFDGLCPECHEFWTVCRCKGDVMEKTANTTAPFDECDNCGRFAVPIVGPCNHCGYQQSAALHESVAHKIGGVPASDESEGASGAHVTAIPTNLPKAQPEPERGTITGMQVSYPATYYLARAHVMAEKYLQHESRWRELTTENMTEHDAFELNFMRGCLWSDMIAAEDAAMAPSPLPVREQTKRDIWFKEFRPIINAIGEMSVQEAMDAIERDL